MLIGILETGHAPADLRARSGSYPEMFQRLLDGRGFDFRSWAVVDMEFPASPREADGWLITGSRHGAYEDLPFIRPLEALIRDAYEARIPLVGICFGHQIMAQALGGRVEKFSGGWAVGPQEYDFGGDRLILNAWHQDQVTELPPDAEVIARSETCEIAGLRYGDRAWSLQPHPEFDEQFLAGLMDTRGKGVVPDGLLQDARARLSTRPPDAPAIADRIAEFFRQPR